MNISDRVRTCLTNSQNTPHFGVVETEAGRKKGRKKERKRSSPLGLRLHQPTSQFCFTLVRRWRWSFRCPRLAQLYLPGVGGEQEHYGEASQQTRILDGKGEEEAATACVFFLTTHLIHFWKLSSTKVSEIFTFLMTVIV